MWVQEHIQACLLLRKYVSNARTLRKAIENDNQEAIQSALKEFLTLEQGATQVIGEQ